MVILKKRIYNLYFYRVGVAFRVKILKETGHLEIFLIHCVTIGGATGNFKSVPGYMNNYFGS